MQTEQVTVRIQERGRGATRWHGIEFSVLSLGARLRVSLNGAQRSVVDGYIEFDDQQIRVERVASPMRVIFHMPATLRKNAAVPVTV